MNFIDHPLACLLEGKTFSLPGGKRARRTSEPTTCSPCKGTGRCLPDPRALDEETCDVCSALGKVFEHIIEDDPMMLVPWTGTEFFPLGHCFAERHTITGERVAYIEKDHGRIIVGVVGHEHSYTIDFGVRYDVQRLDRERMAWEIALRLADAELTHLGYRRA